MKGYTQDRGPHTTFIRAPKITRSMINFTILYFIMEGKTWIGVCVSGGKSEIVSQRMVRVHNGLQLTGRCMCD